MVDRMDPTGKSASFSKLFPVEHSTDGPRASFFGGIKSGSRKDRYLFANEFTVLDHRRRALAPEQPTTHTAKEAFCDFLHMAGPAEFGTDGSQNENQAEQNGRRDQFAKDLFHHNS
jgi:hypothetical protein